ncbi:recombination-associated protein RdgC [Variovorax dokdonensis]|uniref:Recombination-associated protein RdgC n=1 Tax=Variovorax dokdonensis TaxID=344883 RepID=A0ABT7NF71_9BURK|nr:recombination-associated protein RdgC [Variovorax dokdonensis]
MSLFKNVIVFCIDPSWNQDLAQAEEALGAHRFAPCGASQEKSTGWVPPRGQEHGPLIESIQGQWLLEFMIEAKSIPGSVVRRKVDERAAQIEATTGRRPGRKEQKEMKEQVTQELLPMAFSRYARVMVWVDRTQRRLVINASNLARADEVVSSLIEQLSGLGVSALHTAIEPASAMSGWLHTQEPPADFSIDRECELKATDDSKAAVRYAKHALDIDEVRAHIDAGKRPTRLAMTWDDRVSFELTEGLQLRKLVFLEGTDKAAEGGKPEDDFDADAAIATGELGQLLPALIEALGGEQQIGGGGLPMEAPARTGAPVASGTEPAAEEEEAPF